MTDAFAAAIAFILATLSAILLRPTADWFLGIVRRPPKPRKPNRPKPRRKRKRRIGF